MGRAALTALLGAAAIAAGGCGATQTISQAVDPVARAADVTARVPGYRMAGTIQTTVSGLSIHMNMSGFFDRAPREGQLKIQASLLGRDLSMTERISGLTLYMKESTGPLRTAARGKPWVKLDMGKALNSLSLGSLPSAGSNPTQYLDYLRSESDSTRRVGTATVRGAQTTHYHAVVDLNRYPKRLPASRRAAARKSIAALESAIGRHTMPMDVWIDAHHLIRQLSMTIPECVNGQRLHMTMTMDIYAYGPQPQVAVPPASQTTDLTSRVRAQMSTLKSACTATA